LSNASFLSPAKSKARALISGSIAFDTIMVYEGEFQDQLIADKLDKLNVSYLTPHMRREFGGCAANIAYNLAGLGGDATVLATIGHDGAPYLLRLEDYDIDVSAIETVSEEFTAQAFITTDSQNNQIIAFHPGAMSQAHQVSAARAVKNSPAPRHIGIVGPNGKEAMLRHASEFSEHDIAFIFDPGQGLPMFDGDELNALIRQATAVTVNDYESQLLMQRTGLNEKQICEHVEALIITRGGDGSELHANGEMTQVAPVSIGDALDPTGCGDAYRGGLLYGLSHSWDWLQALQLGSVMGAMKIEHQGPQNHVIDKALVSKRYESAYGTPCKLG
jgi:adenosine kinase